MADPVILLDFLPVREGLPHLLTQRPVAVADAVVADEVQGLGVHLTRPVQNALVGGDIDNLTDTNAVLVELQELTLHGHGQLLDNGGVDELALHGVEARAGKLVGDIVGRDDAHVVAGDHGIGGGEADREGLCLLDVLGGLVVVGQADHNQVGVVDAAPGRVHGVGGAVLGIGADDEDGHGVEPGFLAEVFTHDLLLSSKQISVILFSSAFFAFPYEKAAKYTTTILAQHIAYSPLFFIFYIDISDSFFYTFFQLISILPSVYSIKLCNC